MLALVAYGLKPVKFLGPCKRTQHCWPKAPGLSYTQYCAYVAIVNKPLTVLQQTMKNAQYSFIDSISN